MTKVTFPVTIESLTSGWLTTVLRSDGVLKSGRVSKFSAEPRSGGYTSSVFRLELEYEGNFGTAPPSLIIKFHGDSADLREMFEEQRIYEREVRFYQTLARDRALPVPHCHAAEFDPDSREFVLLLEDLSAARQGSWEEDPVGNIRTAQENLAEIHASFWGDPILEQHEWIVATSDLANPPPYKSIWAENLARVKQGYHDQLSDYVWLACDKWLEYWDEIMLCMSRDTHTLVHTDVHLEQMFFPTDELPCFVLFDWQNPTKGWAAEDVIHALVCDLEIEDRRQNETEIFNHYYGSLCRRGVADLSRERFDFQCRLSLVWVVYMFFNILAQPDMRQQLLTEIEAEGDDLREWIFAPLEAAAQDWNLPAILDQAIAEARA